MRELDEILQASTKNIGEHYFHLPIAGSDDSIYRERVYCYELYHQMRMRWPERCQYSLGGEVDKAGHPLIRGNGLDGLKPDFLIHIPGDMRGNFAVIEVKPVTASLEGVRKDLETLRAFMMHAHYERGLLLIYGTDGLDQVHRTVTDLLRAENGGCETCGEFGGRGIWGTELA